MVVGEVAGAGCWQSSLEGGEGGLIGGGREKSEGRSKIHDLDSLNRVVFLRTSLFHSTIFWKRL